MSYYPINLCYPVRCNVRTFAANIFFITNNYINLFMKRNLLLTTLLAVGARYFMALGNHHDNFDNWNSPYQEWNSVNVGPKQDLIKGWAEACKENGLPLGVSIHASHAWTWLEPSQEYDGTLTFGVELKNYQSNDCKFDHFTLEYLGLPETDGVKDLSPLAPHASSHIYDLTGRRVLRPTKGFYIVDGQKVVVK